MKYVVENIIKIVKITIQIAFKSEIISISSEMKIYVGSNTFRYTINLTHERILITASI
jgi:hypothetical protein